MKIVCRDQPKIYEESPLSSFLDILPSDQQGWNKSLFQVRKYSFPRRELSDILYTYNQSIGNDSEALNKIRELKKDAAVCVFTGQQLGILGGPAYTILKASTCISLAKQQGAIPLFWLATEDHDIGEIDHTYLLDPLGNLKKFHFPYPKDGRFVENLQISSVHMQTIQAFFQAIDLPQYLTDIASETSYCRMMARLLSRLFRGTGLIFVEPWLLRPLARHFFQREILQAKTICSLLKNTTQRLQEMGGHAQLKISEGTNLFLKVQGKFRKKIQRMDKDFCIGGKKMDTDSLLSLVEKSPDLFSTNAQARAVLQSVLFPTVAYVAGPGELAYFHQLKDYFHFHGVAMPWVVPRLSATFVTPKAEKMLQQCGLKPWDPVPKRWRALFPELEEGIADIAQEWLTSAANRFDKDISNQALTVFVRACTKRLGSKIASSRLKRRGIAPYSLHYLTNLLYPHETLQEKVINWFEFQCATKENLVQELTKSQKIPNFSHLYCFL